jgi:hypothetical protein
MPPPAPGELRQDGEMRFCCRVGGGDEEHHIGGTVRGSEVDAGGEPREGERGDTHRCTLGVRDRDAAGEPGLVLQFAGPGVVEQSLTAAGPSLRGDAIGERADDRCLVWTEVGIDADEFGGDGVGHGDLQWS